MKKIIGLSIVLTFFALGCGSMYKGGHSHTGKACECGSTEGCKSGKPCNHEQKEAKSSEAECADCKK